MQTQPPTIFGKSYVLGKKGVQFQKEYNQLRNKYAYLIKENNQFLEEYSKINTYRCFNNAFNDLFYAYPNRHILRRNITSSSNVISPLHKLLIDAPRPTTNKRSLMTYSAKFLKPKPYTCAKLSTKNKHIDPYHSFKNFKLYLTIN
jgi:hypothetical protein